MRFLLASAIVITALVPVVYAQPTQPIYLQYDGWVKNADGTYVLSFGYFNMNNVDVAVQPGDANTFTPPPADRNQPTTFLKGRHRFACSMVVDRNFDGKLQWTVKFAGKTSTTTAKVLDPLYELEYSSRQRATAGLDVASAPKNVCVNRPPHVQILEGFAPTTTIKAKAGQEVALTAQIEDDGLPRGSRMAIAWKKASGPADVTFSAPAAASTRARFEAPGTYELELTASDGEQSNTAKVTVNVTAS
jgi:hypothetical protein